MVASALYAANLGGGRPAHIEQGDVDGEICNLGIDARPVLVFERKGCEHEAALKRLHALKGLGSLARKRLLTTWKTEAESQIRRGRG